MPGSSPLPSLDSLPCADKLAFTSRDEAEAAAVYAAYRYGGTKPKVYVCRYCQRFHLATAINTNEEP